MNFLLDLIVLAIIAAVALISARRGFVRVAIELVGFIAAIFITFTIRRPATALPRLPTIPGTLCPNL